MDRKRLIGFALASLALVGGAAAEARSPYAGRYRIANGPDTAGGLDLQADGRFRYVRSEGALDERAEGTWTETAGDIRLTTDPKPIAPSFARGPDGGAGAPALHVRLSDGRELAGIDFRLGLTNGASLAGYTQAEGWDFAAPGAQPDSSRIAWVELVEPIYGVVSPRFAIEPPAAGALVFVLTPNDIETVDFQGAQVERRSDDLVLHRHDRALRLVREREPSR